MARFPWMRRAAPVVFALGVVSGVVFAVSCGGGGGGGAVAGPGAGSQGTWHVWSPTLPISTVLTTSVATIATTSFTTTSADDAVLAVRLEGTVDVALSGGTLLLRITPAGAPVGTSPVAVASVALKIATGMTFVVFSDFSTYSTQVPSFAGTYDVVLEGLTSGSGTTELDVTALRLKVLVLEKNMVSDPSPLFP